MQREPACGVPAELRQVVGGQYLAGQVALPGQPERRVMVGA